MCGVKEHSVLQLVGAGYCVAAMCRDDPMLLLLLCGVVESRTHAHAHENVQSNAILILASVEDTIWSKPFM